MALRTGHGNGAGAIRVEVLPADELLAGTPAPSRPAAVRDSTGKFVAGAGTSELAREGGKAAHEPRQPGLAARPMGTASGAQLRAVHAPRPGVARLAHGPTERDRWGWRGRTGAGVGRVERCTATRCVTLARRHGRQGRRCENAPRCVTASERQPPKPTRCPRACARKAAVRGRDH